MRVYSRLLPVTHEHVPGTVSNFRCSFRSPELLTPLANPENVNKPRCACAASKPPLHVVLFVFLRNCSRWLGRGRVHKAPTSSSPPRANMPSTGSTRAEQQRSRNAKRTAQQQARRHNAASMKAASQQPPQPRGAGDGQPTTGTISSEVHVHAPASR